MSYTLPQETGFVFPGDHTWSIKALAQHFPEPSEVLEMLYACAVHRNHWPHGSGRHLNASVTDRPNFTFYLFVINLK